MRRALFVLLIMASVVGGLRVVAGCLDFSPLVVERDAYAGPDASCLRCLQQPASCAPIIARCEADPRCRPAFACIVAQSCLDLATLDDKINCGLPCAQEAGITSASDPVIATYLVGLVACGKEKCASPCNLGDARLGP